MCAGTRRRARGLALRPLVDEVHTVNLKRGEISVFDFDLAARRDGLERCAGRGLRCCGGFAGSDAVSGAGAVSGARVVYGAAEPRESPASLWYTRKVVGTVRHVVEQNLSLAAGAGWGFDGILAVGCFL